jgi:proteasome assembly chaperone (PAC2) family protein
VNTLSVPSRGALPSAVTGRERWLAAAWPGMGSVGTLAARHLILAVPGERVLEMDPTPWFDLGKIRVKDGIVRSDRGPSTAFHVLRATDGSARDLVVLVADAQPTGRTRLFAEAVVDAALALEVSHVVTFGAMGTPIEPSAPPTVFAAATAPRFLEAAVSHGARPLGGGEIGGMNGTLLSAAARRGMDALCLMGEFPYFASPLPNPKAAAAVLRVFAGLSNVAVDLTELERQGRIVEGELVAFLDDLSKREREAHAGPETASSEEPLLNEPASSEEETRNPTAADRERIERLFSNADGDRAKCLALKAELDRLGAFAEYEDRFLDLFRRGE